MAITTNLPSLAVDQLGAGQTAEDLGTAGQVLTSGGASGNITWEDLDEDAIDFSEIHTDSAAITFSTDDGLTDAGNISTSNLWIIGDSGNTGIHAVNGALTTTGDLLGNNLSGTNTGDQTIELTGDVTGSGSGTFAVALSASSVANVEVAAAAAIAGTKISPNFGSQTVITTGTVGGAQLLIGGAAGTLAVVDIATNPLSATNQLVYYTGVFVGNATATASVRGYQADVSSHASAITTNIVSAFRGQVSAGASSTVVRGIMFNGAGSFGGAGTMTNSAILTDNETFTGDYFINQSGSDANVLGGTLTVGTPETYTPTNVSTDRSYDADSTTLDEIADVLGSLIVDLQTIGLLV